MKRADRTHARAVAVAVAALAIAASFAPDADAAPRTGRAGAEMSGDFPRLTFPIGSGYSDQDNPPEWPEGSSKSIDTGWGFGFGVLFGFSDNIAIEAHMAQSNHSAGGTDWDTDIFWAGGRFIFLHEDRWQPYIGIGGAKLSLETDDPTDSDLFVRLSGIGPFFYGGVDYVLSNRWVIEFRAEYAMVKFDEANIGLAAVDLEDSIDGSVLTLALSFAYRIPML
jgi:outer membrane protein W